MPAPVDRPVEVYRIHPAVLWVSALVGLLLQAFLPLKLPLARLMDFPLLITIYFALVRRNKIFGIALGTIMGLLQDALSHGYIGIFGMAKALVGYLAASSSIRFELESVVARIVLTGFFVIIHNLALVGLRRVLLEPPPAFEPLDMASSLLVNVAVGLILFIILDRFRQPV
jgi:rod shape-determining protein MreD